MEYIKTEEQLADILTKVLGHVKFQELRTRIGIVEIKKAHQGLGSIC